LIDLTDLLCFGSSAVLVGSKLKLGVGIVLRSLVTSQDGTLPVSVYFRLACKTNRNRLSLSNQYNFITFLIMLHFH